MNGKNRIKIITLLLCFILVFNMAIPTKKQEVKAFYPVVAGVALISAACWTMGIYGLSNDLGAMAQEIYLDLDETTRNQIDSKASVTELLNQPLNKVSLSAELWNTLKEAITEKIGNNPNSNFIYTQSVFGDIATSSESYVDTYSPIALRSLPALATWDLVGEGRPDKIGSIGQYQFRMYVSSGNRLELTAPDGTKMKMYFNIVNSTSYTDYIDFLGPIIYKYGSSTPQLRFAYYSHGSGGMGSTDSVELNYGNSVEYMLPNTTNWVSVTGAENVYNLFNNHATASTLSLKIDTERYAEKSTTQAVDDMSLLISTDLDRLQTLSADQIATTEDVSNNVLSIGQQITNAIINLPNTIANAFNGFCDSVLDTINNIYNVLTNTIAGAINAVKTAVDDVKSVCANIKTAVDTLINDLANTIVTAIENALTWAFIPAEGFWVTTFEAIRTPILEKFPHNIAIIESLEVEGTPFNDINVSLMGTPTATIVEADDIINAKIDFVRNATSAFWTLLLVLYVWRKINGFLSGHEIVNPNVTTGGN